jgi:hypothetical protein
MSSAAANKLAFRPYTDGRTPWYKTASRPDPTPFPNGYFVPNFGEDTEMRLSKMNLAKAEEEVGAKMSGSYFDAPAGHPVDYFVPNFGADHDDVLRT